MDALVLRGRFADDDRSGLIARIQTGSRLEIGRDECTEIEDDGIARFDLARAAVVVRASPVRAARDDCLEGRFLTAVRREQTVDLGRQFGFGHPKQFVTALANFERKTRSASSPARRSAASSTSSLRIRNGSRTVLASPNSASGSSSPEVLRERRPHSIVDEHGRRVGAAQRIGFRNGLDDLERVVGIGPVSQVQVRDRQVGEFGLVHRRRDEFGSPRAGTNSNRCRSDGDSANPVR